MFSDRLFASVQPEQMTGHETVWVSAGEQSGWIDRGVAELVELLWQAGLETLSSCEDEEGMACVVFASAAALERFYRLLLPVSPVWPLRGGVFDRAFSGPFDAQRPEDAWQLMVWPAQANPTLGVLLSKVRLPAGDIPAVVAQLRSALRAGPGVR